MGQCCKSVLSAMEASLWWCRWQAASPGAGAGAAGSPPTRNDSDTPEMPAPEKSITWLEPTHSALPFLADPAADGDDEEAAASGRRVSFAGVGSGEAQAGHGAGAAYPASPHPLRGSASSVEGCQRSSLRGSRQSSLAGGRQPSLGGGGGGAAADRDEEEPARKVSFAGLCRGDPPRAR